MSAMGGRQTTALIVGPRGDLRESLAAMLVALLPQDVHILEADDAVEALRLLDEHQPRFVLIDPALSGPTWVKLIEAAHAVHPRPRCSILVDTVREQAEAMKAGADHAAFKGEPPPRLFSQVERLLAAAA